MIRVGSIMDMDGLVRIAMLILSIVAAGLIVYRLIWRKAVGGLYILWGLLFASFALSTWMLFYRWIPQSHDVFGTLSRIEGMALAIRDSQFPIIVLPNQANVFGCEGILYPHLFFYFPAILKVLGVSTICSYQAFIWFIQVLGVVLMYWSMRLLDCSEKATVLATAVYLCLPYRIGDLYWRGAMAEALAMSFLPLVIAGVYRIAHMKKRTDWIYLCLGITGVFQSHILTFVIAIEMAAVLVIVYWKKIMCHRGLVSVGLAAVSTVVINLWYIVPFLKFYGTTNLEVLAEPMSESATSLLEMLWCEDFHGIPNVIGIITVAVAVVCMVMLAVVVTGGHSSDRGFIIYLVTFGVLGIFLATMYFPWDVVELVLPQVCIFQFSFRFLLISCVCLSMAFGILGEDVHNLFTEALTVNKLLMCSRFAHGSCFYEGILIGIIAVLMVISGINEYNCIAEESFDYSVERFDFDYRPEYLPIGCDSSYFANPEPIVSGDVQIGAYHRNYGFVTFAYSGSGGYVDVSLLYYPGYVAALMSEDGTTIGVLPVSEGDGFRIRVELPAVSDYSANVLAVSVRYIGVWYFKVATIISFAGVFAMAGYVVVYTRNLRTRKD